jgi:hypothetical protein
MPILQADDRSQTQLCVAAEGVKMKQYELYYAGYGGIAVVAYLMFGVVAMQTWLLYSLLYIELKCMTSHM